MDVLGWSAFSARQTEAQASTGWEMNAQELTNLLRAPNESQGVELKSWLNLDEETDREKMAKALIALRNNDGGVLVLGFDDKTRAPAKGRPQDLMAAYHADKVQRLLKDWVAVPFEVKLLIVQRDGKDFPIWVVGRGVTVPAITRRGGTKVRENTVYVRSVQNGVVSSIEPRTREDWDQLFRICFDNREADIARFFQRNLTGIAQEMAKLPVGSPLSALYDDGHRYFTEALGRRQSKAAVLPKQPTGWQEVGVVLRRELKPVKVGALLEELFPRQPQLSGWPVWVNSGPFEKAEIPYPNKSGWEALVAFPRPGVYATPLVDFWRLEPGQFYCRRILEDDIMVQLGGDRGRVFDYVRAIQWTAEALAVAQAFGRFLVVNPDDAAMAVRFQWTQLQGRRFLAWSNPGWDLFVPAVAVQSEAHSEITIPLATPRAALVPFVIKAIDPLFDAFGSKLASSLATEIAGKMLGKDPN